jgi:hypothetical protein
MTPAARRPMMRGCFAVSSCFKPQRNRQATDNIAETARCFAVSAFLGNAACEFLKGSGWRIEIRECLSPRTVKQRNRQHFIAEYQCLVCFTGFETA